MNVEGLMHHIHSLLSDGIIRIMSKFIILSVLLSLLIDCVCVSQFRFVSYQADPMATLFIGLGYRSRNPFPSDPTDIRFVQEFFVFVWDLDRWELVRCRYNKSVLRGGDSEILLVLRTGGDRILTINKSMIERNPLRVRTCFEYLLCRCVRRVDEQTDICFLYVGYRGASFIDLASIGSPVYRIYIPLCNEI